MKNKKRTAKGKEGNGEEDVVRKDDEPAPYQPGPGQDLQVYYTST